MIADSLKGSGVGEVLQANRVPLTLIGIGIAWLVAANTGLAERVANDERVQSARRRIGELAGDIGIGGGSSGEASGQILGPDGEPLHRTDFGAGQRLGSSGRGCGARGHQLGARCRQRGARSGERRERSGQPGQYSGDRKAIERSLADRCGGIGSGCAVRSDAAAHRELSRSISERRETNCGEGERARPRGCRAGPRAGRSATRPAQR